MKHVSPSLTFKRLRARKNNPAEKSLHKIFYRANSIQKDESCLLGLTFKFALFCFFFYPFLQKNLTYTCKIAVMCGKIGRFQWWKRRVKREFVKWIEHFFYAKWQIFSSNNNPERGCKGLCAAYMKMGAVLCIRFVRAMH
jgi:hypothetical protein